jgi:hypothetical protein
MVHLQKWHELLLVVVERTALLDEVGCSSHLELVVNCCCCVVDSVPSEKGNVVVVVCCYCYASWLL